MLTSQHTQGAQRAPGRFSLDAGLLSACVAVQVTFVSACFYARAQPLKENPKIATRSRTKLVPTLVPTLVEFESGP